jgi:hypothetical protein
MLLAAVRILVCTIPQDMRRSFDTLALVVQQALGEDPQSGALYVFVGRSATRVKVLCWDRNGYCLLYKRLHRALFRPRVDRWKRPTWLSRNEVDTTSAMRRTETGPTRRSCW